MTNLILRCSICEENIDVDKEGCIINKFSIASHIQCNFDFKNQLRTEHSQNAATSVNVKLDVSRNCYVCNQEIHNPVVNCIKYPNCIHHWFHYNCLQVIFNPSKNIKCRICSIGCEPVTKKEPVKEPSTTVKKNKRIIFAEDDDDNSDDTFTNKFEQIDIGKDDKAYAVEDVNEPLSVVINKLNNEFLLIDDVELEMFDGWQSVCIPTFSTKAKRLCNQLQVMRQVANVPTLSTYIKKKVTLDHPDHLDKIEDLLKSYKITELMKSEEELEPFGDDVQ